MRFKVDENLPLEAAELLRAEGHDAMTVHEQLLTGEEDSCLALICRDENRILFSLDQDFSDIRRYPPDEFPGFIVLRLKRQDKPHVLQVFKRISRSFELESPMNRLWIVDEERIRIRG